MSASFYVYDPKSLLWPNGGLLKFQYYHLNRGGHYSFGKGSFKAPFNGIYAFYLHVAQSRTPNVNIEAYIYTRGYLNKHVVATSKSYTWADKNRYIRTIYAKAFAIIELKGGMEVWPETRGLTWNTKYNVYSSFSGFVVNALA